MPNSTVDEEHLLYSIPLLCQYDDDYTFHFQRVACTTHYSIYGWQLIVWWVWPWSFTFRYDIRQSLMTIVPSSTWHQSTRTEIRILRSVTYTDLTQAPQSTDRINSNGEKHYIGRTAAPQSANTRTSRRLLYSSFETWWHTVTHGRGSEGEKCEWSG